MNPIIVMNKEPPMPSELLEFLDDFLESGDDEEETPKRKENYLSLWHRMNIVVKVLSRESRKQEAAQCVGAFFHNFEDLGSLEESVIKAENIVTQPQQMDS
jgi:hypothetical protein